MYECGYGCGPGMGDCDELSVKKHRHIHTYSKYSTHTYTHTHTQHNTTQHNTTRHNMTLHNTTHTESRLPGITLSFPNLFKRARKTLLPNFSRLGEAPTTMNLSLDKNAEILRAAIVTVVSMQLQSIVSFCFVFCFVLFCLFFVQVLCASLANV